MNEILLIGVTALALGIARPAVSTGETPPPGQAHETPCLKWNLSALSPDVRKKIHLRATDVPPIPDENPRLREAKNWPATIRLGGEVCSLRIEEMDNDVIRPVRSLSEVHPSNGYCLYYRAVPWKRSSPSLGPFYCWSPTPREVWLTEQSCTFQEKNVTATQTYLRYPSGELMMYQHTYRRRHTMFFQHEPREYLEEMFDRGGCLVGWWFSTNNKTVGCYYLGRPISSLEFGKKKVELIRTTNTDAFKRSE